VSSTKITDFECPELSDAADRPASNPGSDRPAKLLAPTCKNATTIEKGVVDHGGISHEEGRSEKAR